jgi:hypothetical protein
MHHPINSFSCTATHRACEFILKFFYSAPTKYLFIPSYVNTSLFINARMFSECRSENH